MILLRYDKSVEALALSKLSKHRRLIIMALTRKMLKAMGIEEDKSEQIISEHVDAVDALKKERDAYKEDAEKLQDVQKKLDAANEAAKEAGSDKYKLKYDALKEEYDKYKSDIEKKTTHTAKEAAYREILKAAGVSEKRIDSVIRVSDIDGIELDESGKVKDAEKLTNSVKSEWADFIVTEHVTGAQTSNPPENNGETDLSKLSMAEYVKARKQK